MPSAAGVGEQVVVPAGVAVDARKPVMRVATPDEALDNLCLERAAQPIADRAASGIETEEKKGRPKNVVPGWVVMVEGFAERAALLARLTVGIGVGELTR